MLFDFKFENLTFGLTIKILEMIFQIKKNQLDFSLFL